MNFKDFVFQNDTLIKQGQGLTVQHNLQALLKREKLPRQHLVSIAKLARRVGLTNMTLRLLYNVIHPASQFETPASSSEKLQYAAALIAAGITHEPRALLQSIPVTEEPETLLYQAICYFTEWRYQEALPFLEDFVAQESIDDYQKLMGRINLCSALLSVQRFTEGQIEIQTVIRSAEEQGYILLKAFALEILAEILIWQKQYKKSRSYLEQAKKTLKQAGAGTAIWVKKWQGVNTLFTGNTGAGLLSLRATKKHAIQSKDWETLRECDLFEAVFRQNSDLISKVYHGTPFRNYRERIHLVSEQAKINCSELLQNEFEIKVNSARQYTFDLNNLNLKPGGGTHKLLLHLAQDFYRPSRVAKLHEVLYPGDFFNPFSSPHRVQEAIRRLKQQIQQSFIQIQCVQSSYRIQFISNVRVITSLANPSDALALKYFAILKDFPGTIFASKDLSKALKISQRSSQRLIKSLLEEDLIQVHDSKGWPRYSLVA